MKRDSAVVYGDSQGEIVSKRTQSATSGALHAEGRDLSITHADGTSSPWSHPLSLKTAIEKVAWEVLSLRAKTDFEVAGSQKSLRLSSCGLLSVAESFLLVQSLGPTEAASLIRLIPDFDLANGLVAFLNRERSKCLEIGKHFKSYSPEDVKIYLQSPIFAERPPIARVSAKLYRPLVNSKQPLTLQLPPRIVDIELMWPDELNSPSRGLSEFDVFDIELAQSPVSPEGPEGILDSADAHLAAALDVILNPEEHSADDFDSARIAVQEVEESSQTTPAIPAPQSPLKMLFEDGTKVRVRPNTLPGVPPIEANGFVGIYIRPMSPQLSYVRPLIDGHRKRPVSNHLIEVYCMDGVDSLSRLQRPNSTAKKLVVKAEKQRDQAIREAQKSKRKAENSAAELKRFMKRSRTKLTNSVKKASSEARRLARQEVEATKFQCKVAVDRALEEARTRKSSNDQLTQLYLSSKLASAAIVARTKRQAQFTAGKALKRMRKLWRSEVAACAKAAREANSDKEKAVAVADQLRKSTKERIRSEKKSNEARGRAQVREIMRDAAKRLRRAEDFREEQVRISKQLKDSSRKKKVEFEEKEKHLRILKNEMAKQKRLAQRKLLRVKAAQEKAVENMAKRSVAKLPPAIRARVEASQADVDAALSHIDILDKEISSLRKNNADLEAANRLMKSALGGRRINFDASPVASAEQSAARPPLWRMLGKKGETYCQDIVELGLTLMAAQLSAEQACTVVRTFVTLEYPEKTEGVDYRIPDASRFREWRRYLEPICHFVGLSVVKLARKAHLSHDATTKEGVHVLQTCVRCEIEDGLGETVTVVDVPLKFEICPSGEALHEAQHISDAFHSPLLGGLHAALTSLVSATSDNAARSTSRAVADLKAAEVSKVREILEAQSQVGTALGAVIAANPPEIQAAIDAYIKLTPEQQATARELHELGCSGHSLNLTVDDCWSKSEQPTIVANMVRDRAARILQRSLCTFARRKASVRWIAAHRASGVCVDLACEPENTSRYIAKGYFGCIPAFSAGLTKKGVASKFRTPTLVPAGFHLDGESEIPDVQSIMRSAAKAFATDGEDSKYYLNEKRQLSAFAKQKGLQVHPLPSVKGSRQSINVFLATALLRNCSVYSSYMDAVRVDSDPNLLITSVSRGLLDRYVQAAMRARSFVDLAFTRPMVFFTHSKVVKRPQIRGIMDCAETFLRSLETAECYSFTQKTQGAFVGSKCGFSSPSVHAVSTLILEKFPELRSAYSSWWKAEGPAIDRGYAAVTDNEFWPLVIEHVRAAIPFMIATHMRNVDKDCSNIKELFHAPNTTDVVESGFAHFDYALDTNACVHATLGVGHAKALKLMDSDGAKVARARRMSAGIEDPVARAAEVKDQLAIWNTTSFFRIPREKRWAIILDVQRNFNRLCVLEPASKLAAHDKAKLGRVVATRDEEVAKSLRRAIKFKEMDTIVPITSLLELERLKVALARDAKAYHSALKDQIRVRYHVYGISRGELPKVGDEAPTAGVLRLEEELKSVVIRPLPAKLLAEPLKVRRAHPAPTSKAIELDKAHLQSVHMATMQLFALCSEGAFLARRSAAGRRADVSPGTPIVVAMKVAATPPSMTIPIAAASLPSVAASATLPTGRVARSDAKLAGRFFTPDGEVKWRVLDVAWSEEAGGVVAWYFEVDAAARLVMTYSQVAERHTVGLHKDPDILVAPVAEIHEWVKSCTLSGATRPM